MNFPAVLTCGTFFSVYTARLALRVFKAVAKPVAAALNHFEARP
ncbi:hypothetical protein GP5015_543 [gamma proteobacterium HTCC5015]|nr:hypothetical protein GP5015_543 [gamma proteobacterium HTCC5015]